MFPLLVGKQTKYSGGQIQLVGLPVCVPYFEGGTGGILGNQHPQKHQNPSKTFEVKEGQVCLRKMQKCGQLVGVFRGCRREDDSGWLGLGKPWKTTVTNARFYPETCRHAGQTCL